MAEKEATVYIVDVGRSMGECHHGRSVTDLEWAMQYVWDKITHTVGTARKTATLSVLALRSDDTSNELREDAHNSNISVLSKLGQVLMPDIRKLRDAIKPSKTNRGDAISAIVVAITMINEFTRTLKYKRKIVLVTNGTGPMSGDGLEEIQKKIVEDGIELVILGVDFDDPEYGVKEEDKDSHKAFNENLLRGFAEGCNGVCGTLEEAIAELDTPRIKDVKSMPSFKGMLRLGDPGKYETALQIPVERYFKTYVAHPPSASSFVARSGDAEGQERKDLEPNQGEALTAVRMSRTYQVNDPSAPGGKVDVERDDLAKGYEYGRTAVHISQIDENITRLDTFACLDLIGFVHQEKYDRYLHMSNANIIIPERANEKASLALSSLTHALHTSSYYAIGRMVTKENRPPMVVLLAPLIEAEYECLIEIQLPFAEDVRPYQFPPLDKVITVSGKTVTEHRNLPNQDLQEAMDNYVDSMELGHKDETGNDILPIDESFSPLLHRIESAVRYRAVHPNDPILDPPEILTKFEHPDEELVKNSAPFLDELISKAEVKKVPPKTKGRKRQRETEKPLSGLDVDALLNQEPKRANISSENSLPEFKQMLSRAENIETIHSAVKQLCAIVESQIKNSLSDANYDRVIEALGTMRDELVDYEEPALYNNFLRSLKSKILSEELGGDRRELWWLLRRSKIGLIDKFTSDRSEVTEEEAKEFFSSS
ncbi:uncharacterized protein N7469_004515 [Penicillium citrinum]|uniref:ATP-dependent DNA helicase II subunit 2 n=2 Tax=Penicillium TaxID=5073 RepID=A0A9W9P799_PENCI|nr:uncharacterized protein N7469_004515 [Penicillium citrinum]KAJ5235347.1 hypothetical protein N7469_004515 [Penicillium citrinum]KAJ5590976.1 hypothetical protein N7450_004948 [Penicillium hetheringtonii]